MVWDLYTHDIIYWRQSNRARICNLFPNLFAIRRFELKIQSFTTIVSDFGPLHCPDYCRAQNREKTQTLSLLIFVVRPQPTPDIASLYFIHLRFVFRSFGGRSSNRINSLVSFSTTILSSHPSLKNICIIKSVYLF